MSERTGPVVRRAWHSQMNRKAMAACEVAQPLGNEPSPAQLSIGFILLNEFTLFTFSGFVDALRLAGDELDISRQRACRWTVMGPTLQPVRANCGVEIMPWEVFPDPTRFDYVAVIGGRMEPQRSTDPRILTYLRRAAKHGIPIVGICTASFVLARAGVMAGRRCCVHWNALADFQNEFPDIDAEADTIFIEDGDRITCPGGQSSADVALHLIARHCGGAAARKAATGMVLDQMRSHRSPQPHVEAAWFCQLREPLIRRAVAIMDSYMTRDVSIEQIAAQLQVSTKTLHRAFQRCVGEPPARFLRILRLAQGHWSLHQTSMSIAQIAHTYRFSDASHFTRMHRLMYGVPPARARDLGPDASHRKIKARKPRNIVGQILAGGLFIFG